MEGSLRDTVLGFKKKTKRKKVGIFAGVCGAPARVFPDLETPLEMWSDEELGPGLVTQPALPSKGRRCDEPGSRVCSRCDAAGLFLRLLL